MDPLNISRSGRIRKKSSKLADFESPDEIDVYPATAKKQPASKPVPVSKSSTLGSSTTTYVIDSVPPDQLMADDTGFLASEDDEMEEDTFALTEADLDAVPDLSDEADEDVDVEEYNNDPNLMIDEIAKRAPIVVARGFLPRFSAYTLFAKRTRVKLLESNPDLDFATLSKEIGDLWAIMSTTEKSNWKKKHARLMKQLLPKGPKLVKHIAHHQAVGLPMRSPILVSGHHNSAVHQPIVAAAHLKLLGESLSVIGQRLTEHNGQIAVSGSLSVLLDALLCAMGPLMCLTKQVPEMNVLPQDKMAKILDNVAYIMPGL